MSTNDTIIVAVRSRPFNSREKSAGATKCVEFVGKTRAAICDQDGNESCFEFDHVYDDRVSQGQVYEELGAPVLQNAFSGFNGTIFAYGQTGSGKTHTMMGQPDDHGLIPRLNVDLFETIHKLQTDNLKFLVVCSFFEIYNEFIYDLLDPHRHVGLQIKEHPVLGVYVKDLKSIVVDSTEKLTELMHQGNSARTQGSTNMNASSSRSHSIFTITIHQKMNDTEGKENSLYATVNLVDLAGSERAARTGAQGDRLKEGANINKSLAALGNVINTLAENATKKRKGFVPYRNSKLTRVLQQSLGGNSKCSMLATLSCASDSYPETLSTLNYANRAKCITVNATRNEEADMLDKLKNEISMLREKLGSGSKSKEYEQQIAEMNLLMKQTWEDRQTLSLQHEDALKQAEIELENEKKFQLEKRLALLDEKADPELTCREIESSDKILSAIQDIKKKREQALRQLMIVSVNCTTIEKDCVIWLDLESRSGSVQYLPELNLFLVQLQTKFKYLLQEIQKYCDFDGSLTRRIDRLVDDVRECNIEPVDDLQRSIKLTKHLFGSITRPKLNSKLLSRPPVGLIMDLVGNLNIDFNQATLNTDNKQEWLEKLISYVSQTLNEAKPRATSDDIVKGLNPLDTNYLLQGIARIYGPSKTNLEQTIQTPQHLVDMLTKHLLQMRQVLQGRLNLEIKGPLKLKRCLKSLLFSLNKALKRVSDPIIATALLQCITDLETNGSSTETIIPYFNAMAVGVSALVDTVVSTGDTDTRISDLEHKLSLEHSLRKKLEQHVDAAILSTLLENDSIPNNDDASNSDVTSNSCVISNDSNEALERTIAALQSDNAILIQEQVNLQEEKMHLNKALESFQLQIDSLRSEQADQITVLVEERDAARLKEEEYFSAIVDLEADLQRTKEGYVWTTDELNDKRDQLSDLQDEFEHHKHDSEKSGADSLVMRQTILKMFLLLDQAPPTNDIATMCQYILERKQSFIRKPLEEASRFAHQDKSPTYQDDFE